MKKTGITLVLFIFSLMVVPVASAQVRIKINDNLELIAGEATESGDATASGGLNEATGSAAVEKVLEEKEDITETGGKAKGELEQFLSDNPVGQLKVTNVLQHTIRLAVSQGVPANTIVLIFLFPLITSLIAAFRHLVGLRGFGIFVPAILAVALVATGILAGVTLFAVILLVATLARIITRKMKLQYLPRMALVIWLVSLGVFLALFAASLVGFKEAAVISIFPILILILLAENFIEVQLSKSRREAVKVTFESLLMAIVASTMVSISGVQKAVLIYPELFVLTVAVFNMLVGRYAGLRVMEFFKFRELLRQGK